MTLLVSISYMYMAVMVPLVLVVPLFYALYCYRNFPGPLRIFTGYLLLNGVGNLIAAVLAAKRINNLPVLHIYTVVEFVLLSLFYKSLFPVRMSAMFYTLMAMFCVFSIVNTLFFQSIYEYNSYSRSVSSIIITIYTVLYFKQVLDHQEKPDIRQRVFPYLNVGLLLYFGGSFFLFLSANQIQKNAFMNTVFWNIHATLVLLMYLLFTIGLFYAKRYR